MARFSASMLWRAIAVALAIGFAAPAFAQSGSSMTVYPAPWTPLGGTVNLSVSNSSANVELGWATVTPLPTVAPVAAWVCNTGSTNAYILMGNSSVAVTTSTGFLVVNGQCNLVAIQGNKYIAGITASSTSTLVISTGNGSPLSFLYPSQPVASGGCLLVSGTTTNCILVSGTTTNALLVK